MNKRNLIVFICLSFLVFSFVGCNLKTEQEVDPREKEIVDESLENHKQEEQDVAQRTYPEVKLEIQPERNIKISGGYVYLSGSVKNISQHDINYFEVIAKFLDVNEQVLDSGYTNDGLKLSPGEMREWRITHRWNDSYKTVNYFIGKVR